MKTKTKPPKEGNAVLAEDRSSTAAEPKVHVRKKAVRVNISVPDDVREMMLQHPEVNWSRVAAKAFRREIRVRMIQSW